MTETATLIQRGPLPGGGTKAAAHYELSQPVVYGGRLYDHVVVSSIEEDSEGPRSTVAVQADERGYVYMDNAVFLYEYEGEEESGHGHAAALAFLGYRVVPRAA